MNKMQLKKPTTIMLHSETKNEAVKKLKRLNANNKPGDKVITLSGMIDSLLDMWSKS